MSRAGFYAYIPTKDGKEPMGTTNKLIMYDLKTARGAHRRARKYLGSKYLLFRYTNFYDDKTFHRV